MTEPTFKQVNYARSLGIENPEECTKEELRIMIDKALNDPKVEMVKVADGVNVSFKKPFKSSQKPQKDPKSMYVSYVKDLVVSGKSVEEAISIVKQAQEAF